MGIIVIFCLFIKAMLDCDGFDDLMRTIVDPNDHSDLVCLCGALIIFVCGWFLVAYALAGPTDTTAPTVSNDTWDGVG